MGRDGESSLNSKPTLCANPIALAPTASNCPRRPRWRRVCVGAGSERSDGSDESDGSGQVVVWNHRGMVASPSGGHVWTMHTTSAAQTAHHRVGRHCWRGKHRHHDSASNRYFAEHDDSPDCPPRYSENAVQNVQMTIDLVSDSSDR